MKCKLLIIVLTQRVLVLTTALFLLNIPVFAQSLKVAVAANLLSVIKVLSQDFKKKTGLDIEPIIGASGNLSNQIRNGAPFDLFLSADMSFPQTLFKEGFAAKAPAVYAFGSLIICSNQNIRLANWEKLLLTDKVKKIAIGNPAIAPYGKAAVEALQHKGILDNIKPKMVYGESISQVNTYITTGVAEVGFTTQSLIKDVANKTLLYYKVVDQKLYSPIEQGIVKLKHADANPDAEKFYQYILSPSAKVIFEEYGYHVQ